MSDNAENKTVIFLATWLCEKSQGEALTKVEHDYRLISFYHTREFTDETLREYLEKGENEKVKYRRPKK